MKIFLRSCHALNKTLNKRALLKISVLDSHKLTLEHSKHGFYSMHSLTKYTCTHFLEHHSNAKNFYYITTKLGHKTTLPPQKSPKSFSKIQKA